MSEIMKANIAEELTSREAPPSTEALQAKEVGRKYPEVIANTPLENTSLIYTVPVMGEWHNGNLLRMIRSMLAQQTAANEAFEIELIVNLGRYIDKIVEWDDVANAPAVDVDGAILLDLDWVGEDKQKVHDLMSESAEMLEFLTKLIKVQELARKGDDTELQDQINSTEDPLQRQIMQLAERKARSISFSVIDLSRTPLIATPYHQTDLSSLRTLGVDMAKLRFENNPDMVISLFDADTITSDNKTVQLTQQLFQSHPELKYVFANMTNTPTGSSPELVADAPRENVKRTNTYNSRYIHGSPQIAFRQSAYDKIQEISGLYDIGFEGDEDFDTAFKLMHHFGKLQDGLLLEGSIEEFPIVMTADRLDGTVDSEGRRTSFLANGVRHIQEDLGHVLAMQDKIADRSKESTLETQHQMQSMIEQSREHYLQRQRVQQRINRRTLYTFLQAQQKGLISLKDGKVDINQEQLLYLSFGEALLHYVRANLDVVHEILSNPDNLQAIEYYLGDHQIEPILPPSNFQQAIGEYVGEVMSFEQLEANNIIHVSDPKKVIKYGRTVEEREISDLRDRFSKVSLMHSAVAEMLALSHIYKILFETGEFLDSRDYGYMEFTDSDDSNLMRFPANSERLKYLQRETADEAKLPEKPSSNNDEQIVLDSWQSFPLSQMAKQVLAGYEK